MTLESFHTDAAPDRHSDVRTLLSTNKVSDADTFVHPDLCSLRATHGSSKQPPNCSTVGRTISTADKRADEHTHTESD